MLKQIEVWGDSILRGVYFNETVGRYERLGEASCTALVQKALNVPLHNHARFGMTSEKGRGAMAREIRESGPGTAALIGFGGNDIDFDWRAIAAAPRERHVPHTLPQRFRENMAEMVALARSKGLEPILMTLPPIDAHRYYNWVCRDIEQKENVLLWLGDVQRIFRAHAAYNDIIVRLAAASGCRLVDQRAAFLERGDYRGCLCADGIHPNAKGHELLAQTFLRYARENAQHAS